MNTSTAVLQIFLLGGLHLEYEGRPLDFPRREGLLRLFARLLVETDRPLARKSLAFSLWPDESEAEALANLRRHLHLLSRALPESFRPLLEISQHTVTWKSHPACWLDLAEFERSSADLPALERAASLYRGDLAQGADVDDVTLARREEVRAHYFELLKTLSRRCAERGEAERGLGWIRKLNTLDPWDEEAVRLRMTLESLSGNRPAALAVYQTLVRSLDVELGTLPLPETMALYTDILHNRLPQPAPRVEDGDGLAFISRAEELTRLGAALRELASGRGQMIFLGGEAGAGKTSLLREALRRHSDPAHTAPPRVFWGACPPPSMDGPRPYAPWRQVLSAAAPILAHEKQAPADLLNWLLPLVPDLKTLRPGLFPPSQPDPDELRAALRQAFHALALAHPLILVIEDLHWADDASLDLLADLGATCASLPLLILASHRSGEENPRLAELRRDLRRQRAAGEINLAPFTADETRLFLENTLGRQRLQGELLRELNAYSRGLPLLLREAADSLQDAQRLNTDIPPNLRAALRLRLERLESGPRLMLENAAVLGFSFLDRELRAALQWKPATHDSALDVLLSRRLLVDAHATSREDYAFSHQVIHEILLGEIPAERTPALHLAAARALEDIHGDSPGYAARIAQHYESAGEAIRAARHWLRHAAELAELAAFDQALEILDRAAAPLRPGQAESRRLLAEAALQRAVIAHHRGRLEIALQELEAALAACREFPRLYCEALTIQAHVLYTCDRSPEGLQSARQAIALARANQDIPAEARALHYQALCDLMLGNTTAAVDALQTVLARLEETGQIHSALYVQNLNYLGTALVFVQAYPRAVETLEKTAALARSTGAKRMESAALTMLGQVALNRGRYGEAIGLYSRAIELAGVSYLPGLWGKYAGRGAAQLRSGDLAAARADFERGLEVSSQVGSTYGRLLMNGYLANAALCRLDTPAPTPLADLERASREAKLQPVVFQICNLLGEGWRLLGESERATAAHQRGMQAAQASGVPLFQLTAHILLLRARADDSALRLELAEAAAQARETGELPLLIQALLAQAESTLHDAPGLGLPLAEEALTLAHACPDQPLIAQTFFTLAALHAQRGDAAAAQQNLSQARCLAEAYFWPLLIQVEALEERLGQPPAAPKAGEYRQALLRWLGE